MQQLLPFPAKLTERSALITRVVVEVDKCIHQVTLIIIQTTSTIRGFLYLEATIPL